MKTYKTNQFVTGSSSSVGNILHLESVVLLVGTHENLQCGLLLFC